MSRTKNPDYPPVSPGTGALVLRPTNSRPAEGVDTGAFRVVCEAARYAKDDPIVFPGQPGNGNVAALPTECSADEDMSVTINFPQCWDGRNLDSPDHKSHMAFTSSNNNRGCPASHPVAFPAISINATFDVTPSTDLRKWRLSSDMYGTDKPAGLSLHGDWMNGWDQGIFERLVKNCLNRNVDCHGSILEDGTELG